MHAVAGTTLPLAIKAETNALLEAAAGDNHGRCTPPPSAAAVAHDATNATIVKPDTDAVLEAVAVAHPNVLRRQVT